MLGSKLIDHPSYIKTKIRVNS